MLNTNGTDQRSLPFLSGVIWDAVWSPTDDLLAILDWHGDFQYNQETRAEYMPMRLFLYNPHEDEDRIVVQRDLDPVINGPSKLVWSPDGTFVSLMHGYPSYIERQTTLTLISESGEIVDRDVDYRAYSWAYANPLFWSDSGWMAYLQDEDSLVVENPVAGVSHEIAITKDWDEYAIFWEPGRTPNGRALIASTEACQSGRDCVRKLWLLTTQPPQIQLLSFTPGDRYAYLGLYDPQPTPWSPSGGTAVLPGQENVMYSVTFDDFNQITASFPVTRSSDTVQLLHHIQWINQGKRVVVPVYASDTRQYIAYVYDVTHRELTSVKSGFGLKVSPDGRYFAAGNIYDALQNTHARVPWTRGGTDRTFSDSRWHPSAPWVIQTVATYPNVIASDGIGYRELGGCYFTAVCANWLPEQVDVEILPPGQPKSVIQEPAEVLTWEAWEAIKWPSRFEEVTSTTCEDYFAVPLKGILKNGKRFSLTMPLNRYCGRLENRLSTMSPDGKLFAISTTHKPILVWDLETGQRIKKFNSYGLELAFSPDSTQLAAKLNGDTVLIWDIGNLGTEVQE